MAWQHTLSTALSLSVLLVLSGCGGSSTEIVELDPVEDHSDDHDHDDDHDSAHGDAPETKGRLLVAAYNESEVVLHDLDDGDELAHYELDNPASAVYASADYRFGVVLQRDAGEVNAVDSGLIREYHDDHWDYTITSPSFADFSAPGPRPTHFTNGGERSVIFYDGNADLGEVAQVGVFSETDMADNGSGQWLTLDTHQHGAAQQFGDSLFATVRDANDDSTSLPDQVAHYHWHDGEYELEQTFETLCPGLHGSAQWHHGVAFGCTDGVLVIHEEAGQFVAEKVVNPAGMDGRIGSLYGLAEGEQLVGIASGELHLIDPEAGTMELLDWHGEVERTAIGYGFDAEGEHFLVLDNTGDLIRLEIVDGWAALEPIEAVTSDLSGLPEDLRPVMSLSHASHLVYITDPVANTVVEVDLESGAVETIVNLDVTPAKVAWLGFEGAHDHAH